MTCNEIKKRELERCDTVKAIMMIMVVICHCAACCSGSGWFVISPIHKSRLFGFISDFTGNYHVQTFVFVSGYLFYYLKYELGKYKQPLEFVRNKAKRLLIPYAFALIWVVPAYAVFFKSSVWGLIRKFILATSPAQLWFLPMLFLLYIGFYFVSLFLDRFDFFMKMSRKTAYLILFGLYLMSFGRMVLDRLGMINIFQLFFALRYAAIFFAGFIFRKFDFSSLYKYSTVLLICSLALTAALCFNSIDVIEKICWQPAGILNAVTAFVIITKYINPKGKVFGILKKFNFQIYIIHQQLIYVIAFALSAFGIFYPYPSFFICLAGALGISTAIAFIFSKFRVTRRLAGIK